jgi:hypothetical protein
MCIYIHIYTHVYIYIGYPGSTSRHTPTGGGGPSAKASMNQSANWKNATQNNGNESNSVINDEGSDIGSRISGIYIYIYMYIYIYIYMFI